MGNWSVVCIGCVSVENGWPCVSTPSSTVSMQSSLVTTESMCSAGMFHVHSMSLSCCGCVGISEFWYSQFGHSFAGSMSVCLCVIQ